MQLAFEATPVRNIQQEIGIGRRLQFLDPRQRPRQLGPEPANRRLGVIGRDLAAGPPAVGWFRRPDARRRRP